MSFNSHIPQISRLVLLGDRQTTNYNSLHLVNKGPKMQSQKNFLLVLKLTLFMYNFSICF